MRRIPIVVVAIAAFLFSGCSSSSGSSGGSCNDAWKKAVAACPGASSNQQVFVQQCNNPSQFPGCGSQGAALADCLKGASSYTCDMAGQPHAVGCDSQSTAFGACILRSFGDAGLTTD
jgi:hypothetical protein